MRKPRVRNKYNLKPADIKTLVVNDRSKIKEPLFWRNDVIKAWCISENIGTEIDKSIGNNNSVWIGIYDKPYRNHKVHYHCNCWGGMGTYKFKEFFNPKEIHGEKDLETQERLLSIVNELLDEEILKINN